LKLKCCTEGACHMSSHDVRIDVLNGRRNGHVWIAASKKYEQTQKRSLIMTCRRRNNTKSVEEDVVVKLLAWALVVPVRGVGESFWAKESTLFDRSIKRVVYGQARCRGWAGGGVWTSSYGRQEMERWVLDEKKKRY